MGISNVRLKLAPPWITYINKLQALFGNDPDVKIEFDNDEMEVKLFVDNNEKADAIDYLLPYTKGFGNSELKIFVIPSNGEELKEVSYNNVKQLFDTAFNRNPVYAYSYEVDGFFGNKVVFVVFKNKVVQFFNDNLNDIHGLISTLYQDIADELFEEAGFNGVFYNTDIEEKVGKPLGEWP